MRRKLPCEDDLKDVFYSEQSCLEYLIAVGVIIVPDVCPTCGAVGRMSVHKKSAKCSVAACRRSVSLLKGTFFQRMRLQLHKAMKIAYCWLGRERSSRIIETVGCSSRTSVRMLSRLRDLIKQHVSASDDGMVGGEGIVVEIDESKFGKRKYHRGHRVEGVWVVGGVERTPERRIFAEQVSRRDKQTLLEIIRRRCRPGTIVHTDLWKGYMGVDNELGFQHLTVNHSQNFVDPTTGCHTNSIEGTWNGMKMNIHPRCRTSEFIDEHIIEFIWRRYHSNRLWEAFIEALTIIDYQ